MTRSRSPTQDEDTLPASDTLLAGVLDIAKDAIISIDQSQHIISFNKGAQEIFGYATDEAIGQSIDLLIPDQFYGEHRRHIAEFIRSGEASRLMAERREIRGRRKNGEVFPAEASISQIGAGRSVVLTVILRDVTERKRAEQALRDALAQVEQLKRRLEAENIYLQREIELDRSFDQIVGTSSTFKKVLQSIAQVASTDTTVLILGETGVGKELIARAIHRQSARRDRPLVKVSCSSLPSTLVESELFGHEKGAFTGAISRHAGRFELADQGTIFLDEIGDLPLGLQIKLLRVLQDGELERVGSSRTMHIDVRVIAATNRDLIGAVWAGDFRQDLYYRLNVFPIAVPPLRERSEDIPPLVRYFTSRFGRKLGKQIDTIPQDMMNALTEYPWPGNVRELENVVERAVILTEGSTLQVEALEGHRTIDEKAPHLRTLEDVERHHILCVLKEVGWKISGRGGAAQRLGLNPSTLRSRMQKLKIAVPGSHRSSPAMR